MALVHWTSLDRHAAIEGYELPVFGVDDLRTLRDALRAVATAQAPAVLAVTLDALGELLLPAVVRAAADAVVPLAVVALGIDSEARAARAAALGVQALDGPPRAEAPDWADDFSKATGLAWAAGTAEAAARQGGRWRRREDPGEAAEALAEALGAGGRADGAAAFAEPWREVEHVIVFNGPEGVAEAEVASMLRTGREALGAIPGVVRVFTGRNLKPDARYRYCWVIGFAQPQVVASFRDHADHVAFADRRFRPLAEDRVTSDFERWPARADE